MEKIHASKLLAGLVPAGFLTSDPEVELVTTDSREVRPGCIFAVSYTHLTLPTILLV